MSSIRRCLLILSGTLLATTIAITCSGCSDNRQAAEGDTVLVHYTGTLNDGTEFDSSVGGDPLEFTLGTGSVIPGFENAIYDMKKGETKTVTIPPEEAYGLRDESLVKIVMREDLPDTVNLVVGQQVIVTIGGIQRYATITDITESTVTLDANDDLAGKTLTFEITLVDIK